MNDVTAATLSLAENMWPSASINKLTR